MPDIIVLDDLVPFADIAAPKANAMIEDAIADASRVAPCINDETLPADKVAQFKSVLRAAILRWNDAGTGAYSTQSAGPFGVAVDTRQQRRGMFTPSELNALRDICRGPASGAYAIDTVGAGSSAHLPWCSLMFGGATCSCGANLTNYEYPLYELDGDTY